MPIAGEIKICEIPNLFLAYITVPYSMNHYWSLIVSMTHYWSLIVGQTTCPF